jgi:hypothetical protein
MARPLSSYGPLPSSYKSIFCTFHLTYPKDYAEGTGPFNEEDLRMDEGYDSDVEADHIVLGKRGASSGVRARVREIEGKLYEIPVRSVFSDLCLLLTSFRSIRNSTMRAVSR